VGEVAVEVGTSRRSDARENRARILAAARLAVAARGAGVPIREIARTAGVGLATVYRHFPSKEALLAEAFADRMAACSEIVAEGLAAPDPWHGFRRTVERLLEMHARDRAFRAYAAQLPRTVRSADRDRALPMLAELIRRAKDAGALRPDVVIDDVALAIMAADGIRAATPDARVAAARRLAALMFESFRAPVPGSP
jgi:Bacterial regulatory proteins, tetR family.